jgi:ribosomal protein S18 acetylase RimI-like enzyme
MTHYTVALPPAWVSRINIRQLVKADLPSLEWNGEFAHFRRLYAEIFQSASKGRAVLWVAEMEGEGVIGQLFVQLNSARPELADGARRAYIYGFRIQPAYRGVGIGKSMLKTAEDDLARRGFRWVTLNVSRDNPDAQRLYERCGYRVVAAEPGEWSYQDENGQRHFVHEPAWRMEKRLSHPNEVNKR